MKRLSLSFFLFLSLPFVALCGSPGVASVTCPASGTKVLSGVSVPVVSFVVQAPAANAGTVSVGNSSVTTANGAALVAGASVSFLPQGNAFSYNLMQYYIACTNTADKVTILYTQ